MKKIVLFGLYTLLLAGIVWAQSDEATVHEQELPFQELPFELLDRDGDRKLSYREFSEGYPEFEQDEFKELDADGDGYLSIEEWEDAKSHLEQQGGS
jgi:hypothetical protein